MSRSRAIVRFLATAAVLVVGTAVVARAAGLTTSGDRIGAAQVATPRCTSAAVTVVETVTTTYVTGVTVSGIPSSCGNATIAMTLAEGTTVYYTPATQTVPAAGGQVVFAIPSGDVPVTAAAEADVVMTGP
jgi:hypothetical protein